MPRNTVNKFYMLENVINVTKRFNKIENTASKQEKKEHAKHASIKLCNSTTT